MEGVGGTYVSLFLCGDVMLGRGVDQILPNAGDPQLIEPFMHDARAYVDLAEKANGPIPRPVGFDYPWGDALPVLDELAPDVRVVNLETSLTRSGEFDSGKSVHYRMSPGNLPALAAGRPDVCSLANNHTLDFGRSGLVETLGALSGAGLRWVGAGHDRDEAQRPAGIGTGTGARVLAFSVGTPSSGVPRGWEADGGLPGVDLVDLRGDGAASFADRISAAKRPGDVVVVSIHWGSNWGYDVPGEHVDLAHRLIDAGANVVHGHSSHHPRPVEVYRGRLILYGCGDFINDYEGIAGYEEYRDDLRLLYLAQVEAGSGALAELRMVPMRARNMRLEHATDDDTAWLAATMDQISADHGVRVRSASMSGLEGPLGTLEAVTR